MSTVIINGKRMNVSGNNISVINNKVYVNGKLVTDEDAKEPVKLIIEGDVMSIQADGDVDIVGNVSNSVKAGGSVSCNNVNGDVKASGSVHCGDVTGNVDASGSVHCGDVGGSVDAAGSIKKRG
jgi:hypothetical protein